MADEEKEVNVIEKIKGFVEDELSKISEPDMQMNNNIDYVGKLVDIHKDIENEEYWKAKKEVYEMRYNGYNDGGYSDGYEYGNYGRRGVPGSGRGRGRARDSRGRYSATGDMIDKMQEHHEDYSESKEAFGRGNYSAKEDTIRSLDYMLKSVCQFMEMLEDDAGSEEEMQLIKKYARKIGEM